MERWKRRLSRFYRMSWKMKILFVIAYFLMGIVRLAIILLPFRYISPMLGKKNQVSHLNMSRDTLMNAAKIGFAVETMSRFTPWESKCLVRAITAQLLLKVFGTTSTLYLGMSKDESNKLIAHAWLKCGDLILTGASESRNFKSVVHFTSLMNKEAIGMKQ